MKDFVGQDLDEGDYVAFVRPKYRESVLGKVIELTPKKVRVQYKPHRSPQSALEDTSVDPSDVIRLEKTDVLALMLKGHTC